jgi:protein NRD1
VESSKSNFPLLNCSNHYRTSENDLKDFFRSYGTVQSCIVNHEKRHAFLKLITHEEAGKVRQLVNLLPDKTYRSLFERINWAVGFGPTDCANYEIGESVIPINLLTDADCKWMLTAEYGGTGGKPILQGMVVEEPDIEIGAGPSSKGKSSCNSSHL